MLIIGAIEYLKLITIAYIRNKTRREVIMEPNKKKALFPKKRSANFINQARRNKARAYANEAPTLSNLYNAFVNWFNSVPMLGGASDYTIGTAPVGNKKLQLLSPQQIKTLLPRDRKAYLNAVNRITERDALNSIYSNKLYRDAYDDRINGLGEQYADRNVKWNDYDFDPELEWLEYKYGGTESYPYLYNNIARRRGLPLMDATGLNY